MKKQYIVLIVLGLLCIAAPFIFSGFMVRLITNIFMYAILASALNVIAGYTGYAAFGNMVFFGMGAYTVAVTMNKLHWPFMASFFLAGAVALTVSILLGLLLLRLKGHYFALGTLGAMEAIKYIVENMTNITGGGQGITIPSIKGSPFFLNSFFYFLMFIMLIIVIIVSYRLSKNRMGFAFKAIRADEEAASVMGINTTYYKIMAWNISAIITGLTGAIYAFWFSYIDPPTVFDVMWVVKMFVMILIGGAGTVFGPVLGAFVLEAISELVWSRFMYLHLGILGLIIVLVVFFMPGGIMNIFSRGKGIRGMIKERNNWRVDSL